MGNPSSFCLPPPLKSPLPGILLLLLLLVVVVVVLTLGRESFVFYTLVCVGVGSKWEQLETNIFFAFLNFGEEVRLQIWMSEAANLDVFFFLDFGHFLVLLET